MTATQVKVKALLEELIERETGLSTDVGRHSQDYMNER